ncbi:MAG: response regulator [Deltaproteobacteria bacterium]|nr:response regulator [Deltaproteobacteria bacterium]
MRILVVDDDFATRLLASEALISDGFATTEAEDGRAALIEFDRATPDAILLDVNMPELDGYEVCRRVRQRASGAATPIMVMTASDDLDAVRRAFAAGATDFLTKPLNLLLLAHRVRYMLRASSAVREAQDTATRLTRAQRLARMVHWQVGHEGQFAWASDPLAVFWPDAPANPPPCEHILTLVHPDDRDRVAAALHAPAGHQLDFRLRLPDGTERLVHQDAELYLTDRGGVLIGATQDVTAMRRAEEQIAQLAFYDDLTGLPNRPFVDSYLRRIGDGQPRAAIAIDLGLGHLDRLAADARDALIRAAAARVIERVRGADLEIRLDQAPRSPEAFTGETLVARTAGDELMIITTQPDPAAIARRLADALRAPFTVGTTDHVLRPRCGVATAPEPVEAVRELEEHARGAMVRAERSAPRNVVVFSAASRELRARHAALAASLARALDEAGRGAHPDLAVEYLPRRDHSSLRLLGLRARPSWQPGIRDPLAFAAILEAAPALRQRLAMWTLGEAVRDAARWHAAGATLRVAIELPHAPLAQPGFADQLRQRLETARCTLSLIDLELTDAPLGDGDLEQVGAAITVLRDAGLRIALTNIDDASTIGQLRRLPHDAVRLDRATIDRLGPAFLATTAALARALGMRLAVTDIDAPAAFAAVAAVAPDELAGALVGVPMSAAEVPSLVSVIDAAVTERPGERGREPTVPAFSIE